MKRKNDFINSVPILSVIIPTKNEEKTLPACLHSLYAQKVSVPWECIIVDGYSADSTRDIAKSQGAKVFLQPKPGKNLGAALKFAVTKSHGTILCFTEADCVVPAHWLQTIYDTYKYNPEVTGLTGTYVFFGRGRVVNLTVTVLHRISLFISRIFYKQYLFRQTNFSILREVYDTSGGFSEQVYEMQDVDLSRRAGILGVIRYVPEMRVQTSDRRFQGRIFKFIGEFVTTFINVNLLHRHQIAVYEDIR